MTAPTVRPSLEVIEHHGQRHLAGCGSHPAVDFFCPCGTTLAIVCSGCGNAVYFAIDPGSWCEHAEQLKVAS